MSQLAIYLFVVVYRMFQEGQENIKRISLEEVIECFQKNEGIVERLKGTHERFLNRIAGLQTPNQPHVLGYVADALVEEDERKDVVRLKNEQKGFLYLLLITVVDALDQKGIE